jgi:dihydroflavonol-4-reductase
MNVLVTGGSGFIGSHLVARLARDGHRVRVLARDPGRLGHALAPHGEVPVEVVDGDVRDASAVRAAVAGCEAVVHAANVYSLDVRRREEMERTNVEGTHTVLHAAVDAGCAPVVHVSSMVALLPADGPLGEEPALGTNDGTPYIGSKVRAERIARELQEAGAPVVTTYPGAVFGPHDPGPGEMVHLLRGMLGSLYVFRLGERAGFSVADVRWVADVHAGLLTSEPRPRRVTVAGPFLRLPEAYALLRSLTGRRMPSVMPSPRWLTLASARGADAVRHLSGLALPMTYEQVWMLYGWVPAGDRHAMELAGAPPPVASTLTDATRWAIAAGHLPARWGGVLAQQAVPEPSARPAG